LTEYDYDTNELFEIQQKIASKKIIDINIGDEFSTHESDWENSDN